MKRSELYEAVWKTPVSRLAEDFGLSDTGLRDVCRRYGVPLPGRGYWPKQAAGKELPAPDQLPGDPDESIDLERLDTASCGATTRRFQGGHGIRPRRRRSGRAETSTGHL